MKKGYADRDRMMAEARSLLWVVHRMSTKEMTGSNVRQAPNYVGPLGYLLSSIVLQALAAETALKALQVYQLGYFYKTHDLAYLFKRLGPGMQQGANIMYQALVRDLNEISTNTVVAEGSIEKVLKSHARDFEEWRYFFELPDGSDVSLLDIRHAALALILSYDILTVDPAAHDPAGYAADPMKWITQNRMQWLIGIND